MDELILQIQREFSQGVAFLEQEMPKEGLACFLRARELSQDSAVLYLYSGVALHELKRFAEAVDCYQKALQIEPDSGEIHNNLGNSLLALGLFEQAAGFFRTASYLLPASPVPLAALASALFALGKADEAKQCCCEAIQIAPDFAEAHWNLALCLLLQGDLEAGWREYEWRWKRKTFTSPTRHADIPLWDGYPLDDTTILLHAEQGFGDAIQFVRYAPLVAQSGGTVIIECHPQLVSLFSTLDGVLSVVPFDAPLPPFSCHAPLLSLPGIFKTELATIPSKCPYLAVPAELRTAWALRMGAYPETLRVGLAWAGKSYPDPLRSCQLKKLAPLATGAITFFSLQLGEGARQASSPPADMQLVDLTQQIHDFADTAALIEQLDLVISVDTAVAHLAGALGKPAWLLLPFAPDWRWLLGRSDSPWYPSMRIFRQELPGEWDTVINMIADELNSYAPPGQSGQLR